MGECCSNVTQAVHSTRYLVLWVSNHETHFDRSIAGNLPSALRLPNTNTRIWMGLKRTRFIASSQSPSANLDQVQTASGSGV